MSAAPSPQQMQALRQRYARQVVPGAGELACGALRERLLSAFAQVPREAFVEPPAWARSEFSWPLWLDELYQDRLVALDAARGINNGQPSLHARCLAELAPASGETAVHVGAGTGYYSALLAELLGPAGTVHAYEIEASLADRARRALAPWPQVMLHAQSALGAPLPACDLLYVSAGVSELPSAWLDALREGGRAVLPLTTASGQGWMLRLLRRGTRWTARRFAEVVFIPCQGARNAQADAALAGALLRQPEAVLRSLRRGQAPDASAWCVGPDWWLSTREEPA